MVVGVPSLVMIRVLSRLIGAPGVVVVVVLEALRPCWRQPWPRCAWETAEVVGLGLRVQQKAVKGYQIGRFA